ncbi:MAG: ABC transporter permease, partial [Anaeroplasmataceae bacterium]|nr:ABC transporter permease [Anaeroplasmataceae bacterium]
YDIILGRDLSDEDYKQNTILIPSDYVLYKEMGDDVLNQEIKIGSESYQIVGVFTLKKFVNEEVYDFILNYDYKPNTYNQTHSYAYRDYEIVNGRAPKAYNECIASIYSNYNVGDIIYDTAGSSQTFEVVGLFNGDNKTISIPVLFSREVVILSQDIYYCWMMYEDPSINQDILEPQGFSTKNIYDYYYDQAAEYQKDNLLMYGIMALILIVAVSVFIYFMMRSRMIADIYPIGVYRSIGASRTRILLRFVSDIFVTITLTALVGYLFTTFIFDTVAANINNTLSMNALKSSYLFGFLGALILYVLNFFFGLLPIVMLMRKTPAEIIAKYDI